MQSWLESFSADFLAELSNSLNVGNSSFLLQVLRDLSLRAERERLKRNWSDAKLVGAGKSALTMQISGDDNHQSTHDERVKVPKILMPRCLYPLNVVRKTYDMQLFLTWRGWRNDILYDNRNCIKDAILGFPGMPNREIANGYGMIHVSFWPFSWWKW